LTLNRLTTLVDAAVTPTFPCWPGGLLKTEDGPEVVVVGGGVIEALSDEMLSIITETANDYAMPGTMKGVDLFASTLGDEAGITGGAVLAKRMAK
jgi:predicted NBD/HSP70 family sugar kinase